MASRGEIDRARDKLEDSFDDTTALGEHVRVIIDALTAAEEERDRIHEQAREQFEVASDRIERLESERDQLAEDRRELIDVVERYEAAANKLENYDEVSPLVVASRRARTTLDKIKAREMGVMIHFGSKDVPAFPSHGTMGEVVQEGMTLREYYAGLVMQGLLADGGSFTDQSTGAHLAVAQADALIAALQEANDD